MANNKKAESVASGSKSVILTAVICGILLVGVIVWAAITKSANDIKNKVAMTVGETEISGAEFEYQYKDAILSFQTQNKDFLAAFGIDFEGDLGAQQYTEDQTWKEYFISNAVASLTERYLFLNDAEDAGYTLPEEDKQAALDEIEALENALTSMGVDFNAYLQSIYSRNLTYSAFKNYTVLNTTAYSYYQNVVVPGFGIDDAKLESYYGENKDDIDTVDFRYHLFSYTVPSGVAAEDDSYKADAKAKADAALAAITDEASFDAAVEAQLAENETASVSFSNNVAKSNLLPDLATWLFDSARVAGDKTVIEGNNGFFVIYFVAREKGEYETVNVRHILVTPEVEEHDESDESIDDAAIHAAADEAAKAKAEEILNEWLAGDKTEDSFAKLATEKASSYIAGEKFEQVTKGYMVEEFDSWIFDSARKPGDCDIVKTDYGYHLIYFVGADEIAWKIKANAGVESEEYNAYVESLKAKYEVVTYDEVMNLVD